MSAFIESLGLRPLDTGDLAMAHWLEAVGPLLMGLARHGAGFNIALGVNVVSNVDDVPELSTEKITQVVRSYIELAGHGSAAGHRSADEVAALFADNAIFESPPAATSIAELKRFAVPTTQCGTAENRKST